MLCQPGLMNLHTSNYKSYIVPRLKQGKDVGICGVKLRTSSLRAAGRFQGRLRVLQTPTLASSGQRCNEKSVSAAALDRKYITLKQIITILNTSRPLDKFFVFERSNLIVYPSEAYNRMTFELTMHAVVYNILDKNASNIIAKNGEQLGMIMKC